MKHWTNNDPDAHEIAVVAGFINQIRLHMAKTGVSQADLAGMTGFSQPHVSQVLSHPKGLTVATVTKVAHALGLGVALVAHELPVSGLPVSPALFEKAWTQLGRPEDVWEFDNKRENSL